MGRTMFLFAQPSAWSGVARIVDLGGTYDCYNRRATGEEADAVALWNDWHTIGDDLRGAIMVFADKSAHESVGD